MNDFNPNAFTGAAFIGVLGVAATVVSAIPRPGSLIDEQRLIEHDIGRARLARVRSRAARKLAEAALASMDASAALRLAASARNLKR